MKKIFIFSIFTVFIFLGNSDLFSQLDLRNTNIAYFCGFEDPQENSQWILESGSNTNKWKIGKAVSCEDEHSLYVSADNGNTAGYINTPGYISIYREFIVQPYQSYTITFDWFKPLDDGELWVSWIPNSSLSDPSIKYFDSDVSKTPYLVTYYGKEWSQGGEKLMQRGSSWQNAELQVYTTDILPCRLVFTWKSKSDSHGNAGGAIDNIQIGMMPCGKISDLTYDLVDESSGEFSWKGGFGSIKYDFKYKNPKNKEWLKYEGLTTKSVRVPRLQRGTYKVWIRMICGSDTSMWFTKNTVPVYKSEKGCIDFWELNAPYVTATTGNYGNPYQKVELVDKGPGSVESRLTVHNNTEEFDVKSLYQLKTIPPGDVVSVRLGNWGAGKKAESVTYDFQVDSTALIMLLKYAAVLEDPGHQPPESHQPKFQLDIIDHNGNRIDPICGYEYFVAGPGTKDWKKGAGEALWKDWTTYGINLMPYIGKTIKIRLTTYDCADGAHFGYAYFTLECISAKINGLNCGENTLNVYDAPEGFSYEWYNKSDSTTILSRDRSYTPPSNKDTTTYVCKMSYKEGQCSFRQEINVAPTHIISQFEEQITYENCQAKVQFNNTSYAYTDRDPSDLKQCETFYWDLGDGRISREKSPAIIYETPGTYNVKLICGISQDKCTEVAGKTLIIEEFKPFKDSTYHKMCTGDFIEWNNEKYEDTGLYTVSLKTVMGCDSILILKLDVHDKFEESKEDTLCLYKQEFYDFNGKKLTETGMHIDTLASSFGCDSIVTLNLIVYQPLRIQQVDLFPEICLDKPQYTYEYELVSGDFNHLKLHFDEEAKNAGFQNIEQARTETNLGFIPLELPENILPGTYNATLIFEHPHHGNNILHIEFMVSYPSIIVEQKWNDVLAVLNAKFNGGYNFIDFQWYKNGIPIPGQTKSYLYLPSNLDFNSEYSVKVTRAEDNISAYTCPKIPEKKIEIGVYPTLVPFGETVTVETPVEGKAILWDVMGLKIKEFKLNSNTNSLIMPKRTGSYILEIITDDNINKKHNIMIN